MLVKLKDKKCVGVLGACLDKVYGNPHSLDQVHDPQLLLSYVIVYSLNWMFI